MNVLKLGSCAVVIAVALSGSAWAGSARDDIAAAAGTFAAAFNSGDAAGVAAHYSEDAAVLPPDGKRVDGRANIEAFWKGAIDGGLKNLSLQTVEVEESGDIAYEIGGLSLDAPGDGGAMSTVKGKYIVVWKRGSDGTWRLHRDIWNMGAAD